MTIIDERISPASRAAIEQDLFGHVIDGTRVESAGRDTLDIVDPATGRVIAKAAAGTASDADAAARSARTAFEDGRWRNQPPMAKEKVLRTMAALVAERGEVFAEVDVLDAGLLRSYTGFIVQFAVDGLEYFSGWPSKIEGAVPAVPREFNVYQTREPIGVVGFITPWNGPTAVFAMVAAALAAGNSVVLKPAEQTPMAAVLMAELAIDAGLPPGVFNVVQGTGECVGASLVDHPEVDAISFTGSVATGSAIQAAAAKRVKRVSLELGGKSPFIVFPDADLEAASASSRNAVWGASGQVCTCGTRVLVHDSIYDEFVNRIVDGTKDIKIGAGMDPTSEMGPLVSAAQLERVKSYVAIGQEEGAELVLGGNQVGDAGYFHEPTVFTGVRNDMRIAQEEIFGPVMGILPFTDEDDAYRIANDVSYGLAAGVWTNDLNRAQRASRALKAGTVWVNTYQMVYPSVPYGGVKLSGHGRTLGAESVLEFTSIKSVWMAVGS
jgi:phenylacetaldehyde dehydrogenase